MSRPLYTEGVFAQITAADLADIPWISRTEARQECFMSLNPGETYTYGSGRGIRTYTSIEFVPWVMGIMYDLNQHWSSRCSPYLGYRVLYGPALPDAEYNVCFLNRYDNEHQHLGWHSDDTPGMLHEHPIAVVSFGQPREIWWRRIGEKGVVPSENRQLLGHGSLFEMPPGFQLTHQHRIPKGDRAMEMRVSLTFRRFVP